MQWADAEVIRGDAYVTNQQAEWPGKSLGMPSEGPGAMAGLGQRIGAYLVDALLAALITWAFTAPEPPQNWSVVPWAVITVVGVGAFGVTPGHLVAGTRVATFRPAGRGQLVGLWALPRTALVAIIFPPLIRDRDGRGLHDRLCHTVVVRSR